MLHEILVILFISVIYLAVKYWNNAIGTDKRNDLSVTPVTRTLPILGNLIDEQKNQFHGIEYYASQINQFGPGFSNTIPFMRFINCTRPEWIEHIQKTNARNYIKGRFMDPAKDVLGDGIFAVDGHQWVLARKTTSMIFTSRNFSGIISEALEHDIALLKSYMQHASESGEIVKLSDTFFAFTLSSFMRLAFGVDPDCLTEHGGRSVPFAQAFDYAQEHILHRITNPFWRITEKFSPSGKRIRNAIKIMDDYTYSIIDKRIAAHESGANTEQQNLLDLFLNYRDDDGTMLSRSMLRDTVLNLIIAGRDTTAQALSWTFFRLLNDRPDVIKKIRAEVDEIPEINFSNFKQLSWTMASFQEALRLHPSVPRNAFVALRDDKLPNGGPKIKKGDVVVWSDWAMARNTDVWGKDAQKYKPERWFVEQEKDEGITMQKFSPFKYHVFNAGSRLCLGMNLALFEATLVIAMILRHYDLSFSENYFAKTPMTSYYPEEKTPMYKMSMTLPMLKSLEVMVTPREF